MCPLLNLHTLEQPRHHKREMDSSCLFEGGSLQPHICLSPQPTYPVEGCAAKYCKLVASDTKMPLHNLKPKAMLLYFDRTKQRAALLLQSCVYFQKNHI